MRLTLRDAKLIRDIALSHVLSRDQLIALGYFSSVTRANTRLRELVASGYLRRIETPYFSQSLYIARHKAGQVTGNPVASLLSNRSSSPRFLRHALTVTNVRIGLLKRGAAEWRFEQQLWSSFEFAGRQHEIRPDGLAFTDGRLTLIEVDLCHVTPMKFRDKLRSLDAFHRAGLCQRLWHYHSFDLQVITTGPRRAARLRQLLPAGAAFGYAISTFAELGLPMVGSWS